MLPGYNDATMWGPQGDPNAERSRLKPGDKLTDGRVFAGDNPQAVLEALLKQLDNQITPLISRRNEVLTKLIELAPEKYGHIILGVEDETTIPTTVLQTEPDEAVAGEPLLVYEPFMEGPLFAKPVNLAEGLAPPDEEPETAATVSIPDDRQRTQWADSGLEEPKAEPRRQSKRKQKE